MPELVALLVSIVAFGWAAYALYRAWES